MSARDGAISVTVHATDHDKRSVVDEVTEQYFVWFKVRMGKGKKVKTYSTDMKDLPTTIAQIEKALAKFKCKKCGVVMTEENSPLNEMDAHLFKGYCYDCEHTDV